MTGRVLSPYLMPVLIYRFIHCSIDHSDTRFKDKVVVIFCKYNDNNNDGSENDDNDMIEESSKFNGIYIDAKGGRERDEFDLDDD